MNAHIVPIDPRILTFERHYETKAKDPFEGLQDWPPAARPLLDSVLKADWWAVESLSGAAFSAFSTPIERTFVLQWAVRASETRGDHGARRRWLEAWNEIPNWVSHPYCRYLKAYHEGMTHFFNGNLREAEIRLRKTLEQARELAYARGQIRALFHLALVRRDLEDFAQFEALLREAERLANSQGFMRFLERIEDARGALNPLGHTSAPLEAARRTIVILIGEGRATDARAELARAEQHRRRLRLGRKVRSFFIFLPAIAASRGRNVLSTRLLARISDPILRIQAFDLKRRLVGLSPKETEEWNYLREVHGLSLVLLRSPGGTLPPEICGISLATLDDDLRNLMNLLLETEEAVGKERICRHLWNIEYDPTTHDAKLYKLIHRARSIFKNRAIIRNTYGGYRINIA